MADAYGILVFSKSDGSEVNLDGLAKVLNSDLRWSSDGGDWLVSDSWDLLVFSNTAPQYPTLAPETTDTCHCYDEPGKSAYSMPVSEMTEADWACFEDADYRRTTLEEIRDLACPFIYNGWIEIAYSSNEQHRYVEFAVLRIHADGRAERVFIRSGPCGSPIRKREEIQ
jgi:hypothetical protein